MARGRQHIPWSKDLPDTDLKNQSDFELEVERLQLQPREYVSSIPLRYWAQLNRKRRYVPEELLRAWGMELDPEWGWIEDR